MLIVNASAIRIGKRKVVQLFIDGEPFDILNQGETKKYHVVPGKHEITAKVGFYVSKPVIIDVKDNNETHAYELEFKADMKLLLVFVVLAFVGIGIDALIRLFLPEIANISMLMNSFLLVYFMGIFGLNVWITKSRYLKLNKIVKK